MWGTSAPGSDVPSDHDVVIVLASVLCAMIAVLGMTASASWRGACEGAGSGTPPPPPTGASRCRCSARSPLCW